MSGIGNTVNGGYHMGVTFPPDTNRFVGCTFEAPCVIPAGSILENCTFVCMRKCGFLSKNCCPVFSTVGAGSISIGTTAEYVRFESTGRADSISIGPEGNVTSPGCVGCSPWGQVGTAITANTDAIVGNGSTVSAAGWCNARMNCTDKGTIIVGGGGKCTVTINGVTTITG
jgi:hypothetical protein